MRRKTNDQLWNFERSYIERKSSDNRFEFGDETEKLFWNADDRSVMDGVEFRNLEGEARCCTTPFANEFQNVLYFAAVRRLWKYATEKTELNYAKNMLN